MADPPLYPIFLDLNEQPVLVVGAGAVALRKVHGLLEAGAKVTVISPHFSASFAGLTAIEAITGSYDSRVITQKPWRLVFAATHDAQTNARVQQEAAAAKIPCCRCDELERSDFTNGATARIGPITLAVSTHGAAPALARRVRDLAQHAIDPTLVSLAELSVDWRRQVKQAIPDHQARKHLLQKIAGAEMERTLRTRDAAAADALFHRWLAEATTAPGSPSAAVDHA